LIVGNPCPLTTALTVPSSMSGRRHGMAPHLADSAAPHGRRHCSPSATTRAAGAVTAPGATTRQRRAGTLLPAAGGALGTPRRQRAPASPSPSLPSCTPRPPSCSTPPPASPSSSPSPSSPRPLAAGSPLPSLPSSPWLSSPALLSPASFGREPRPPASPSRLAAVGEPARTPAPPPRAALLAYRRAQTPHPHSRGTPHSARPRCLPVATTAPQATRCLCPLDHPEPRIRQATSRTSADTQWTGSHDRRTGWEVISPSATTSLTR